MCLPAPYLPNCSLFHTRIRSVGLWFWGRYDTIQILAAYTSECALRRTISLQSPDFPCPAALIHMAQEACVNSLVFQLEGLLDPQGVTHCSLSTQGQFNHYEVLLSTASYTPKRTHGYPHKETNSKTPNTNDPTGLTENVSISEKF